MPLSNPGFEVPDIPTSDAFSYPSAQVGWLVEWLDPACSNEGLLELQHFPLNPQLGPSAEGDQHAELDSMGCVGGDDAVRISQGVATLPGREYLVRFFTSPRDGAPAETDGLSFLWDGVVQASIPGSDVDGITWTEHQYLVSASASSTLLGFEPTGLRDGYGMFLDGVSVSLCLPSCVDADGDGYNVSGGSCGLVDCDDAKNWVYPGAPELCSPLGIDENCDGNIDEGCPFGVLEGGSCEAGLTGWACDSRNPDGSRVESCAGSNTLEVLFYADGSYHSSLVADNDTPPDHGAHRFWKPLILAGSYPAGTVVTWTAEGVNSALSPSTGNVPLDGSVAVTIHDEVCDNLDNDCDGFIDEGLDCGEDDFPGGCSNFVDDDKDGFVDEADSDCPIGFSIVPSSVIPGAGVVGTVASGDALFGHNATDRLSICSDGCTPLGACLNGLSPNVSCVGVDVNNTDSFACGFAAPGEGSYTYYACLGENSASALLNSRAVCGDEIISPGESCDGANWGLVWGCESFGLGGDGLRCVPPGELGECSFDLSGCEVAPLCLVNGVLDPGEECDPSGPVFRWGSSCS
ncbi:MAG: putative metal-binding motif-containing protein, partial [Candidatus Thorarchaeota archaeon]